MNYRVIMKYFSGAVRVTEKIRVASKSWTKCPPIFIYQFGKVGSSSVYHSLKTSSLENPVYHVHYLTQQGIDGALRYYKRSDDPVLPHHLILSPILARRMDSQPDLPYKIITLVRDPVDRAISDAFENIHRSGKRFVHGGRIDVDGLSKEVLRKLEDPQGPIWWVEHWLESELGRRAEFNCFNQVFEAEKGWKIYNDSRYPVLLVRLEDLNKVYKDAVSKFLDFPRGSVQLSDANMGEKKWYADDYKLFKEQFVISDALRQRIYSTRYISTFYPDRYLP